MIELHKYCRRAGGAHVGSGQSMANELLLSSEHVAGKSKLPVSGLDSDMLFRWNLYTPLLSSTLPLAVPCTAQQPPKSLFCVNDLFTHIRIENIDTMCTLPSRSSPGRRKRHREGEAERKLLFSIQKSPSRWLCDAQRARIFKDSLEDGLLPLPACPRVLDVKTDLAIVNILIILKFSSRRFRLRKYIEADTHEREERN